MTDYFALLDQPRRPWLDLEQLKQAFHAKSRSAHPDVGGPSTENAAFAQVNEAHQVLRDPKRRLQHLLSLAGREPPRLDNVPPEIAELFGTVATLTQEADGLARKSAAANNSLSRSLLRPEMMAFKERMDAARERISELLMEADRELHTVNASWRDNDENDFAALHRLYARYAYLTRWLAQLETKSPLF